MKGGNKTLAIANATTEPAQGRLGLATDSATLFLPKTFGSDMRRAEGSSILREGREVAELATNSLPDSNRARHIRAEYELEFGEPEIAYKLWQRVVKSDPTHVSALEGLVEYYKKKGDVDQPVNLCRRVVEIQPHRVDAKIALGVALLDAAMFQESAAVLSNAVGQDPQNAEAHVELACALIQQDQPAKAKIYLETALQLAPNQRAVYLELGKILVRLGDREQAKQHFKKYRQLQAEFVAVNTKARRDYDDAQQNRIDVADLYVKFGQFYFDQGNRETARKLLERARKLDSQSIEALQLLSLIHKEVGQWQDAIKLLEQITELYPTQYVVVRDIAQIYLEQDKYLDAEQRILKFVAVNRDNLEANVSIAQFYLQKVADPGKGVEYAQNVTRIEPTARSFMLLAACQEAAGSIEEALAAIEQAIELEPQNIECRKKHSILRTKLIVSSPASSAL